MSGNEPATGRDSAVVLLNFGGPRNLEEVEEFLFEILRDPNTIQLPIPQGMQDRLAAYISRRRAPEVRRQYSEIGGRSPIVAATAAIAESLREGLASSGVSIEVFVAHRYLRDWAGRTAAEIVSSGVKQLYAIPLYPHFSYATGGSSLQQLQGALERAGYRGSLAVLRSYPEGAGYLEALGDRLSTLLDKAAPPLESTVILCSAHGLPLSYVKRGDPYRDELERSLEQLRSRFPHWRLLLSFQSRVGPARWLKPYTDEIIPELAQQGVTDVVFLPLSFINDHIETLYEIGETYFNLVRGCSMKPHLVPAVEDHPAYIRFLTDAVEQWRGGGGGTPPEEMLPPENTPRRTALRAGLIGLALLFAVLLLALL